MTSKSSQKMDVDVCTQKFVSLCHQTSSALTVKVDSPISYTITVKEGFHYESFNPNAQLQAWNILKLVEYTRIATFWSAEDFGVEPFMNMNTFNGLFFTAAADLHISEDLYNVTLEKRPVTAVYVVDHIGRTSFKAKVSLYLPGLEKPIVVSSTQFVLVDQLTRKPCTPPSKWLEKYTPMMEKDAKPLHISPLMIPEGIEVLEDEIRIHPSDNDPYMHVNWTNYCKLCYDVYTLHHVQKCGATNARESYRSLKSFESNYRGEASMGDVLQVKFWHSGDDADKFHFLLFNKGVMINESTLVFYPLTD